MADLIINGGETYTDLVAGTGAGADYQVISVMSGAELTDPGKLGDFTVSYGGKVRGYGGVISNGTVKAGGSLANYSQYTTFADITVEAGGSFLLTSARPLLMGRIAIAEGTWIDNPDAFTGTDGAISGVVLNKHILIGNGVTFAAPALNVNNIELHVSDGAKVYDADIAGGRLYVSSNGVASNVTMAQGMCNVYSGGSLVGIDATAATANALRLSSGTYLAGTVKIAAGVWQNNTAAFTGEDGVISGALVRVQDFAIGDGVSFRGIDWRGGGWNFHVSSGAKVYDTVVNSNGRLYVYDGGLVSGGRIEAGRVYVSGGVAEGLKLNTANYIYVYDGGVASDIEVTAGRLTLDSGASAGGVTATGANTLDIGAGACLFGANNITAGAWYNNTAAFTGEDGVISSAVVRMQDFSIGSGAAFRGLSWTGAYNLHISSGAAVYDPSLILNGSMYVYNGGLVSGGTMEAGKVFVSSGGVVESLGLNAANAYVSVYAGGVASNVGIGGNGRVYIYDGGVVSGVKVNTGLLLISSGASAAGIDTTDVTNANALRIDSGACLFGTNIITAGAWYQNAAAFTGENGVISSVQVRVDDLSIGSGVKFSNVTWIGSYGLHVSTGAAVYSPTLNNGGSMYISSGATTDNVIIKNGGMLTLRKYGQAALLAVSASAEVNIDFTDDLGGHGNTDAVITNWGTFNADAKVTVSGLEDGYSYKISDAANSNVILNLAGTAWDIYDDVTVKSGEAFANAFSGKSYDFMNGTTLALGTVTVATETGAAASLTNDDAIAGGRAIKWDSSTGVTSGNVFLAGDMTSGQAWVELDGYNGGAGTTLYGAQGSSFADGTVNINAKSGSLRNLAAGANAGGTVKAVNLTFAGAELDGTGYAGGFGTVKGETNTKIKSGTFTSDFYAGALANYNKTHTTTSAGNITMEIADGTFDGNIYGAASVKTGVLNTSAGSWIHSAGNIELDITSGTATKGDEACIFAGGYAAGHDTADAADRTAVYEAGSVTLTISGGNWGEVKGGRGVFGGAFASDNTKAADWDDPDEGGKGVYAKVGDVNITVIGGTMGNVYGGGWAQKGGKSEVGDVNINIEGGTITNIFGGGCCSISGGSTKAGDVTITVSGGNIDGAIFAKGQGSNDEVGNAEVIFTGNTSFSCDVFGYGYVGGGNSDATLSFTGYTGTFSGKLGGFNGIKFDGATAMMLSTAAGDVSNSAWEFDLTGRADTLAGSSLLTWEEAGSTSFTNVSVKFADDTQAQGGWNIATVVDAFGSTTFDVEVGGELIGANLALDGHIASGEYQDWGFTVEDNVLKFKNLA